MKKPISVLSVLTIFLILLLLPFLFYPNTPYQPDTPTQSESEKQYEAVTSTYKRPDWTLSIPQIDFEQQMVSIQKQGRTLPVPESAPGFYSEHEGNLFIVGHNQSTFRRLNEAPKEIFIYQNNSPSRYLLTNSETASAKDINMESLLTFRGVILMTCAGELQDGNWTHRLILYYQ